MKPLKLMRSALLSFIVFVCHLSLQADDPCTGTCYATPYLWNTFDYEVKASYLYWGVQEDQLGFAFDVAPIFDSAISNPKSEIKTHHPKWDSGFRLECAVENDCFPFEGNFGWTYFRSSSEASAHGQVPPFRTLAITTTGSFGNNGSPFLFSQTAHSKWDTNINEFTLDLKYHAHRESCLSFDPYIGIMGAMIDQHQRIKYVGVSISSSTVNLSVSRNNKFYGIGPRLGIGFKWNVCDRLSLISNATTAYLVGKFDMKNKTISSPNIPNGFLDFEENMWRGRPMASGLIGIEWKGQINDCAAYSLAVSYEYQYWWQQWHSASHLIDLLISGDGRWGDLSLQGLVVSGDISF